MELSGMKAESETGHDGELCEDERGMECRQ